MSLPQLLNYLRFLRWRRSSSKTKACKFFKYSFSARRPLNLSKQILFYFAGQLLLPACTSAPSALHRKTFRPLFQINPFPALDAVMSLNFINSGGLLIAKTLLYDRLNNLLLEFWCIAFIWYSFRHSKAPHLLFSISYCLTNGVQFKSGSSGFYFWLISFRLSAAVAHPAIGGRLLLWKAMGVLLLPAG